MATPPCMGVGCILASWNLLKWSCMANGWLLALPLNWLHWNVTARTVQNATYSVGISWGVLSGMTVFLIQPAAPWVFGCNPELLPFPAKPRYCLHPTHVLIGAGGCCPDRGGWVLSLPYLNYVISAKRWRLPKPVTPSWKRYWVLLGVLTYQPKPRRLGVCWWSGHGDGNATWNCCLSHICNSHNQHGWHLSSCLWCWSLIKHDVIDCIVTTHFWSYLSVTHVNTISPVFMFCIIRWLHSCITTPRCIIDVYYKDI